MVSGVGSRRSQNCSMNCSRSSSVFRALKAARSSFVMMYETSSSSHFLRARLPASCSRDFFVAASFFFCSSFFVSSIFFGSFFFWAIEKEEVKRHREVRVTKIPLRLIKHLGKDW